MILQDRVGAHVNCLCMTRLVGCVNGVPPRSHLRIGNCVIPWYSQRTLCHVLVCIVLFCGEEAFGQIQLVSMPRNLTTREHAPESNNNLR